MYIIVMLCNDDNNYYTDIVNKVFNDIEVARNEMIKCAIGEIENLEDNYVEMINLAKTKNEIIIYDKFQEIITQYNIYELNCE